MENMTNSILWDLAKFILSAIVIPFGIWVVHSHGKLKEDVNKVKEDSLMFKEEVAKSYAAKVDMSTLGNQIDAKITNMQTAVTQRIDTMQSNIATMIASLAKGKD